MGPSPTAGIGLSDRRTTQGGSNATNVGRFGTRLAPIRNGGQAVFAGQRPHALASDRAKIGLSSSMVARRGVMAIAENLREVLLCVARSYPEPCANHAPSPRGTRESPDVVYRHGLWNAFQLKRVGQEGGRDIGCCDSALACEDGPGFSSVA